MAPCDISYHHHGGLNEQERLTMTYIWGGGVWVQLLKDQGARDRVVLVLCDCIWNAHEVSLVLPAFDQTGYLGYPPHQVVYSSGFMAPPWVTSSHFLAGNREAELKPNTLSSLLLLNVSYLCSSPDPPAI